VSHTVQSEGVQTSPVDVALLQYLFSQLQPECQLAALSELFTSYMNQFSLAVPNDFLSNAANAMVRLTDAGRTNVLYNLAKGIGTLRLDGSDSCFPTNRMPMGLVEYIAQFFAVDNLQQVNYLVFFFYVVKFILLVHRYLAQ